MSRESHSALGPSARKATELEEALPDQGMEHADMDRAGGLSQMFSLSRGIDGTVDLESRVDR